LKFFSNGVPSEYNGGRTEPEIVSWMKKKTGPATKALNDVAEVESFTAEPEVAVVYFGSDEAGLEAFNKVAKTNDDFLFGVSSNVETFEKFGVQKETVVIFKKFDEKRNDLT